MSEDPDFKLPLYKYYFTFGGGHHHGPQKRSLQGCYTMIEATESSVACVVMNLRRDRKWSHVYGSEESAGVKKFGLTYIPFEDLLPQVGRTI